MKTLVVTFAIFLAGLVSNAQCNLDKQTYLPEKDAVASEAYGMTISIDDDIMVVGAYSNDSLAADCGLVFVYQLNSSAKWVKIAELVPSDPAQYRSFGSSVCVNKNTIAVMAIGSVIYIFEKPSGGNWTSGSESYKMNAPAQLDTYGKFIIKDNELVVASYRYYTSHTMGLEIFNKVGGVFESTQFIKVPSEEHAFDNGFDDFAIGNDYLIMTSSNYILADLTTDARAIMFNKNGSSYAQTPSVILRPGDRDNALSTTWRGFTGFGTSVAIDGSTIFVTASAHVVNDDTFNQGIYIFEKPASGWVNSNESYSSFVDDNSWYNNQIAVTDNYIITSGGNLQYATGYRKTGLKWSDGIQTFKINRPTPGSNFGFQSVFTDKHLVISSPADYTAGTKEPDIIFDYYAPENDWENSINPSTLITETDINATYDYFGQSLSSYGNLVMIGSPQDDEKGIDAGAIYIYEKDKPVPAMPVKLFSPQIKGNSQFGSQIITGDSMLFVGAIGEDYYTGKVYIFKLKNNNWIYHSQLIPPEIKSDLYYGSSMSYHNGYLAIAESSGSDRSNGCVNIYKKDSNGFFQFITTLRPSVDERSNAFGRSIVMNDSIIAIGTGVTNGGSIYYESRVFIFKKKTEWSNDYEVATLQPSINSSFSDFGCSLSMEGNYIAVGASRDFYDFNDPNTLSSGSVYIFKKPSTGWKGNINEIAKLLPHDPVPLGNFGYSVAIDHEDILIGAPQAIRLLHYQDYVNDTDLVKPGTVYHYIRSGVEWQTTNEESSKIVSERVQPLDAFGSSLLIADRTVYVGAFYDNTNSGFRSGSVQAQKLPPAIQDIFPLCSNFAPVQLEGYPSGGTWNGDGISVTGIFNPTVAGAGLHSIKYTFDGCTVSKNVDVKSFDVNVSSASPPIQLICKNGSADISLTTTIDATHYVWSYKDSVNDQYKPLQIATTTIHTVETGYYQIRIDDNLCPSYYQYFQVQNYPDVDISINPQPSLCPKSIIKVEASPTGGTWSGTGITSNGVFNSSPLTGGDYKVVYKYISLSGCNYKDSTYLHIDPVVNINLPQEPVICSNEVITLNATPAGGTWVGQDVTPQGVVNSLSLVNGDYKMIYKLTTSSGCNFKDSTTLKIDRLELPFLKKESDYVCTDSPSILTLIVDDMTTVQWIKEPDVNNVIGTDKTLSVTMAGKYYAIVSKHSCQLETQWVEFQSVPDSLFVPNIIIPTMEDHGNAYLQVQGSELNDFNLTVMNRYGKEVFQTNDQHFKWAGDDVSEGVYFWRVTYLNCVRALKEQKGWVQILK